jgi:hypothetical protein
MVRMATVAVLSAAGAGEPALARSLLAELEIAARPSVTPTTPVHLGLPLTRAAVLHAAGERDEAVLTAEAGLTRAESALGPAHPLVGEYLEALTRMYALEKRHREAADAMARALAIQENLLGANHPRLNSTLAAYENVLRRANRKKEARLIQLRANNLRRLR